MTDKLTLLLILLVAFPLACLISWYLILHGYKRKLRKLKRKAKHQEKLAKKQVERLRKYELKIWLKNSEMKLTANLIRNKQHRHHVVMSRHLDKIDRVNNYQLDCSNTVLKYRQSNLVDKIEALLSEGKVKREYFH